MSSYKHNIEEALKLVVEEDYHELSGNQELWNDGINQSLDPNMPFELSFDEHVLSDSFSPTPRFKHSMISWLNDCLLRLEYSYVKQYKDVALIIEDIPITAYYALADDKIVIFYDIDTTGQCYSTYWCIDRDLSNGYPREEIESSVKADMLTRVDVVAELSKEQVPAYETNEAGNLERVNAKGKVC